MAYARPARPVIAYQNPRRFAPGYRNKIVAVLGVTVIYTAFLYRSGVFWRSLQVIQVLLATADLLFCIHRRRS